MNTKNKELESIYEHICDALHLHDHVREDLDALVLYAREGDLEALDSAAINLLQNLRSAQDSLEQALQEDLDSESPPVETSSN